MQSASGSAASVTAPSFVPRRDLSPFKPTHWPEIAWFSLPPDVRRKFSGSVDLGVEMSPPASARDFLEASGALSRSAMDGNVWGGLGATGNMALAAAGMIPGGKLLGKGATHGVDLAADAIAKLRARQVSKEGPIPMRREAMIKRALKITDEVPDHARYFAEHIGHMNQKAIDGKMTVRDLIKAHVATTTSMNRQAIDLSPEARKRLAIPGDVAKVRPEEAVAFWMKSPAGQAYLNMAEIKNRTPEQEKVLAGAIEDAVGILGKYGLGEGLRANLGHASREMHDRLFEAVRLITNKNTTADDWTKFASDIPGIGEGKAGWFGSLLGFGKAGTVDRRESKLVKLDPYSRDYVVRTRTRDVRDQATEHQKHTIPWLLERYPEIHPAIGHEVYFGGLGLPPELTKEFLEHWRNAALQPGSLGPISILPAGIA